MLDNPTHQGIRRISSIVLPSILGGSAIQNQLNTKLAGGALLVSLGLQSYQQAWLHTD